MAERLPQGPGHVAVLISSFSSGGVPRKMLTLTRAFAERGHRVDLLVTRPEGPLAGGVSPEVRLVDLSRGRVVDALLRKNRHKVLASIPGLARYLRRERPDVLLAAGNYVNAAALAARALAATGTRVAISQNSHMSREAESKPLVRWAARHLYPRADAIITVSCGVARDLEQFTQASADRFHPIYNPTVRRDHAVRAAQAVEHPWLAPGEPPVVLGVGRLHEQKDFPTLLRAFARVRAVRKARLVILGEGRGEQERTSLLELAAELGVRDDFELPGFSDNVAAWMSRAAVFVLSSRWEGFPNALVEALASGCPTVSTRCPSGPDEILEGGRYGPLVPVGDDEALATSILALLESPPERERLVARARAFDVDTAVDSYLRVLLPAQS